VASSERTQMEVAVIVPQADESIGSEGVSHVVSERSVHIQARRSSVANHRFDNCVFSGELAGVAFSDCSFVGCIFDDASMSSVTFHDCLLENCLARGGYWFNVGFRDSRLLRWSFSDTTIDMFNFIGGAISNVILNKGSIVSAIFNCAAIGRVAFSEATVEAVFRDCDICEDSRRGLAQFKSAVAIVGKPPSEHEDEDEVPCSTDLLAPFRVNGRPTREQLQQLEELLSTETDESKFQKFLEANLELLAGLQSLGHHGTYVIPQVAFGNKHRADFMVATKNSMGHFWTGLEIESPKYSIVNADGHLSSATQHAINQVRDWKNYVRHNRTSVQQPRSHGGEGLIGIEPEFDIWVIIGREADERDSAPARRQVMLESHIHIQTWDGFRDRIAAAVEALGR
jgi:Domain of unknown function (DUF4263)/Pentapeptide repeats (9 copies)